MTQEEEYKAGVEQEYEIGQECAKILDAEPVHAWFDHSEKQLMAKLLATDAGDKGHAEREGIVSQLRAILGLKNSLSKAVTAGDVAESQLKSLTSSDEDDT